MLILNRFILLIKELILMQVLYSLIFIVYILFSAILIKLIYKNDIEIEKTINKIIIDRKKFFLILNISNLIAIIILGVISMKILKYSGISISISIVLNFIFIYCKKDSIYLRFKSKR